MMVMAQMVALAWQVTTRLRNKLYNLKVYT
jgi:hypothetical protein